MRSERHSKRSMVQQNIRKENQFTLGIDKIKRKSKRVLAVFLVVSVGFMCYTLGSISNIDESHATTISGNMTKLTTYSEEINVEPGWYLVELCGGGGRLCGVGVPYYGAGGKIEFLLYMDGNYTIDNYSGAYTYTSDNSIYTHGGDAIMLKKGNEYIVGAGGGGATVKYGKNTYAGGNVPGGSGKNGGTGSTGFSSGGSANNVYSAYQIASAITPFEDVVVAGSGDNGGGGAGSNYVSDTVKNVVQPNNNVSEQASYSIKSLQSGILPTKVGLGKSGSVTTGYTANEACTYTLDLKTNGGDTLKANIALSAGDNIQFIRTKQDAGASWLVYLNGETVLAQVGGALGSLTTTVPQFSTAYWTDTLSNSYVNTEYLSEVEYNNTTPTNTMTYTITAKAPTVEDSYDYSKRQAVAQESMVATQQDIATAITQLAGNAEIPTVTVVAGKEFSICVGKYDDMVTGTVDGVTVTNNVQGDGLVVLSGTLNTPGIQNIVINGKKFGITVVSEPNSSNVLAAF